MFRESSKIRKLFSDYLSPEAMNRIENGEMPEDVSTPRKFDFIWIWFPHEHVCGPEYGEALELAVVAGALVELFPPIAAFWFGEREEAAGWKRCGPPEEFVRYAQAGAKVLYGTTAGYACNVGSKRRFHYTVITPDLGDILTRLAASDFGTVSAY